MRHVIIGNGIAGVEAAGVIRALDPGSSLTIIAREIFPPYCRPMVSLVLAGTATVEQLPIRPELWYHRLGIDARVGETAEAIDLEHRVVTTDRGGSFPFDRLLVASGSDPRAVEGEGMGLDGVFFMRTEAHVRGMLERLPEVKHALVLGGGLVGFKAAYGLLHRGISVTMLIRSGYPLAMQVDAGAGDLIRQELERKGLLLRLGAEVSAFEGGNGDRAGRVARAHLSDGTTLDCDLAVIGKGVVPTMGFLPPEIVTHAGVSVDEHLETSVPGIYAAGDVAESVDVSRQKRWVNAVWPVAVEQGRVAGMNMAGRPVKYPGSLSRNVIRIYDLDVLTAGIVNPDETDEYDVYVAGDPRRNRYRKLVLRDGVLVGAVLVGGVEQGGVLMALINNQRRLDGPIDAYLDPSFNFGQVIA